MVQPFASQPAQGAMVLTTMIAQEQHAEQELDFLNQAVLEAHTHAHVAGTLTTQHQLNGSRAHNLQIFLELLPWVRV